MAYLDKCVRGQSDLKELYPLQPLKLQSILAPLEELILPLQILLLRPLSAHFPLSMVRDQFVQHLL